MATATKPHIEFLANGVILIHLPKTVLVLTRTEFARAIERGKAYQRATALEARVGR
jgi:hypothetical protein